MRYGKIHAIGLNLVGSVKHVGQRTIDIDLIAVEQNIVPDWKRLK